MNWIRKHRADIILTITSIIITLVIVDTFLYFTRYRYVIRRENYPRYYFLKDAEIGLDISPKFATSTHYFDDAAFPVWSNNIGCFDRDYTDETPYIYMAGDSLTWGFVPFEDSWGRVLERELGIRTVKCGVTGGFGTKQERIKAERLFSKLPNPEIIIVGYTEVNDFDDDANFPINTIHGGYVVKNLAKDGVTEAEAEEKYRRFDRYCTIDTVTHPVIAMTRCFLSNHSVLYNIVKKDIRAKLPRLLPGLTKKLENTGIFALQKPTIERTSEAEYQKHLKNVLDFKDLAREQGARLLFVLGPFNNEKIISFLMANQIAYIDLRPIFDEHSKSESLIWKKDGHWNVKGNHLVGEVVARYIKENFKQ